MFYKFSNSALIGGLFYIGFGILSVLLVLLLSCYVFFIIEEEEALQQNKLIPEMIFEAFGSSLEFNHGLYLPGFDLEINNCSDCNLTTIACHEIMNGPTKVNNKLTSDDYNKVLEICKEIESKYLYLSGFDLEINLTSDDYNKVLEICKETESKYKTTIACHVMVQLRLIINNETTYPGFCESIPLNFTSNMPLTLKIYEHFDRPNQALAYSSEAYKLKDKCIEYENYGLEGKMNTYGDFGGYRMALTKAIGNRVMNGILYMDPIVFRRDCTYCKGKKK